MKADRIRQYPLSIMGIPSVQKVSTMIKNKPSPQFSALRFRANIYRKPPSPRPKLTTNISRSSNKHPSLRRRRLENHPLRQPVLPRQLPHNTLRPPKRRPTNRHQTSSRTVCDAQTAAGPRGQRRRCASCSRYANGAIAERGEGK